MHQLDTFRNHIITERGKKESLKKSHKRDLVAKEVPRPKKLKAKENVLQAAKAEVITLLVGQCNWGEPVTSVTSLRCACVCVLFGGLAILKFLYFLHH